MEEPKKETYGYQNSTSFEEESHWMFEDGEEEYYKALSEWEDYKNFLEIEKKFSNLKNQKPW